MVLVDEANETEEYDWKAAAVAPLDGMITRLDHFMGWTFEQVVANGLAACSPSRCSELSETPTVPLQQRIYAVLPVQLECCQAACESGRPDCQGPWEIMLEHSATPQVQALSVPGLSDSDVERLNVLGEEDRSRSDRTILDGECPAFREPPEDAPSTDEVSSRGFPWPPAPSPARNVKPSPRIHSARSSLCTPRRQRFASVQVVLPRAAEHCALDFSACAPRPMSQQLRASKARDVPPQADPKLCNEPVWLEPVEEGDGPGGLWPETDWDSCRPSSTPAMSSSPRPKRAAASKSLAWYGGSTPQVPQQQEVFRCLQLTGFKKQAVNSMFVERPNLPVNSRETYWSPQGDFFLYYCQQTSTWAIQRGNKFEKTQQIGYGGMVHSPKGYDVSGAASSMLGGWLEWNRKSGHWEARHEAGVKARGKARPATAEHANTLAATTCGKISGHDESDKRLVESAADLAHDKFGDDGGGAFRKEDLLEGAPMCTDIDSTFTSSLEAEAAGMPAPEPEGEAEPGRIEAEQDLKPLPLPMPLPAAARDDTPRTSVPDILPECKADSTAHPAEPSDSGWALSDASPVLAAKTFSFMEHEHDEPARIMPVTKLSI
eukprot:TRINITY_DN46746_c0_g1_i1.p1 TRINITY_DN46746_c0_g1~~TRINITY_DN46746_c0_g1_i1.p1  ORF type:complete len:603 (-),score=101.41 TRINITY_DN46746_c0_g1_i1:212-2020(-)